MRGRSRAGRRATALAVALAAVVVSTAGCVGVTDREDFDAIVDSRGGGLSSDLVLAALDAVEAEVGTDDLELTAISINPGSRIVVMTVRDPVRRDNLDSWVYRDRGGLDEPQPVRVGADDDLDAAAFMVSEAPALERTEQMADAAFAALDFEEPHVESITGSRSSGTLSFFMSVESDRASGNARFAADGTLVEAARS